MSSRTVSYSSNLTVAPAMFWGLLLASLAVRLYAVIISPLEPSVDEAQYWLWGQTPQLGYYSKPPLIAWILAGTSSVFDHQYFGQLFALRISAPLIHTLTALFLWQTGRLLFSDNAGRLAAILWISLPAVGLGSFVMSTDTPLLLFWSAGLYCLVRADETFHPNYRWMGLAGICVGLATLAKYAGLYFILSLILWIMTSSFRKPSQKIKLFGIFFTTAFFASLPTWLWNYNNGFVTLLHLTENANFTQSGISLAKSPGGSFEGISAFWGAQFFVFGPVTLLLLVFSLARVGHGAKHSRLHLFIWPVLAIMTGQAFLSEANANWAVTAYPAATILVGQFITTSRSRFILFLGKMSILVNFLLCCALIAVTAIGSLSLLAPASDPFRHLRGWAELAQKTEKHALETGARTIIAYNRRSAALLHWYLQDTHFDIVLPRLGPGQGNHYHRTYPLDASSSRPLLALTTQDSAPSHLPISARWQGPTAHSKVQISRRDHRQVWFWRSD